eukprot:COSAG02_NODE_5813_length_4020_cov_1.744708_6_plen_78_part_00
MELIERTDKCSRLRGPPRAAVFFASQYRVLILEWFWPRLWIESWPSLWRVYEYQARGGDMEAGAKRPADGEAKQVRC